MFFIKKIRKPIITVLGHVDHGKTMLLDRIRGTTITEKEAGKITQHIGATEIPIEVIKDFSKDLTGFFGFDLKIPGLLFIDTPGHEAFTNLRKRGGNIADLAVLVIDIKQKVQKQTIEAIEILKSFKVPFIVVANKIDLIQGMANTKGSFLKLLKELPENTIENLDNELYLLIGELSKYGFEVERFDRIKDFTKEIALIPVSAKTGTGMPELLMLIAGISQKYLSTRLEIDENKNGKGTVLEVKEERGLGKTLEVILYDGNFKVNDEIAFGTLNGVKKSKIKAILAPIEMKEIGKTTSGFKHKKQVNAAAGIKIVLKENYNVIPGTPIKVVKTEKELKEIEEELQIIEFDNEKIGLIVKADTLGSLEAIIKLFKEKGIEIKKAAAGDVNKQDVMEAKAVKEIKKTNGVIIVFNVKVPEELRKEIKKNQIKLIESNVIYELIENYVEWSEKEEKEEKKRKESLLNYPAKLLYLKGCSFRNKKPAIFGVKVLEGKLKINSNLMKEGKIIGKVARIESEGKSLKEAEKGLEIAISVNEITLGKEIKENDVLYTAISFEEALKWKELKSLNEKEIGLLSEITEMIKEVA